jgi:hypothetical protein
MNWRLYRRFTEPYEKEDLAHIAARITNLKRADENIYQEMVDP